MLIRKWDQIVDDFRKVDVLVTNAGLASSACDFEEWKNMLDVNANGPSCLQERQASA